MIGVNIPVFYDTDKSDEVELLGEDDPFPYYETREVTFYRIDAVSIHRDKGRDYGRIHSGGDCFTSPWSKQEINDYLKGK